MTTEATYIILSLTVGSTSLTAAGPVKVTRGYIHNGLAAVNVPVQDIFEYSLKSTHDTCSEQSNANQSTWYHMQTNALWVHLNASAVFVLNFD